MRCFRLALSGPWPLGFLLHADAAQKAHVEACRALLAEGAKATVKTRKGLTPLHLVVTAKGPKDAAPGAPSGTATATPGHSATGRATGDGAERDGSGRAGVEGGEGEGQVRDSSGHAAVAEGEVEGAGAGGGEQTEGGGEAGKGEGKGEGKGDGNGGGGGEGATSLMAEHVRRCCEVVRLLVRKCPELLSEVNKQGETAHDLATDPAVKSLLQSLAAVPPASKRDAKKDAGSGDKSVPEKAAGSQNATSSISPEGGASDRGAAERGEGTDKLQTTGAGRGGGEGGEKVGEGEGGGGEEGEGGEEKDLPTPQIGPAPRPAVRGVCMQLDEEEEGEEEEESGEEEDEEGVGKKKEEGGVNGGKAKAQFRKRGRDGDGARRRGKREKF